jgi:DNA-binding FrmR family transcriptional regulator
MDELGKEKQKLVARIKRSRGQVDSIECSLTTGDDCADVLMLLADVRSGVNSLMAQRRMKPTARAWPASAVPFRL